MLFNWEELSYEFLEENFDYFSFKTASYDFVFEKVYRRYGKSKVATAERIEKAKTGYCCRAEFGLEKNNKTKIPYLFLRHLNCKFFFVKKGSVFYVRFPENKGEHYCFNRWSSSSSFTEFKDLFRQGFLIQITRQDVLQGEFEF